MNTDSSNALVSLLTVRRVLSATAVVCLLSVCLAQTLAGQSGPSSHSKEKPYALIYGTVYGPDERGVYGVKIKIRRADEKKAKWELYSDHRGEFAQRVPVGEADYIVWADVKTHKNAPPQEVKVHISNDERQDVGLHLTE